jgi:hypothetical protein
MSSLAHDWDIKQISDRRYRGQDYHINPAIIDKPFEHRKCTDVLMGFVFFAFLCGLGGLTYFGYQKGHPA